MEFIIIAGMSGAGKTTAMHTLEDLNFYCVDNLPAELIPIFYDLCVRSGDKSMDRVALVVDIKAKNVNVKVNNALTQLAYQKKPFKILFLDADDSVLAKRYKETRRKHPMIGADDSDDTLLEAIKSERELLSKIKEKADYLIDSSLLSVAQTKTRITSIFMGSSEKGLSVTCISFGFKYGVPAESDLVFDVRCLPNPYYIDELKHKTGLDKEVSSYVLNNDDAQELLKKLIDLIDYLLPLYVKEGKSQLVIAVGCTGGKHRSVTFAQEFFNHLSDKKFSVSVHHRDIQKG